MSNTTAQKFLVNCSNGKNDLERATVSFILAVTASKTAETAMFVTSDAADIVVKGGADGLVADGYESLPGLIDAFVENGGKIWLCPACAKAKGITENDVRQGVEIAGAPRSMAFLASGAQVLA
ncbi:MAG: DsrE family protein [Gammaproteobacteria bacterium]|nr:DsrE family protein [Gammaproteobacteria bacterium]